MIENNRKSSFLFHKTLNFEKSTFSEFINSLECIIVLFIVTHAISCYYKIDRSVQFVA